MLSNARGNHVSPGVYVEEIDKSYAVKSLGATTLGVIGETLKGPAFEPVRISNWTEFQEYFGGTSTEKFKGTGLPKYELPYIAKSYLQESKQLEVCRILGFSGYDAGPAWIIYGVKDEEKYPIVILRSKASFNNVDDPNYDKCNPNEEYDKPNFLVSKVEMGKYFSIESAFEGCDNTNTATEKEIEVGEGNYGSFKLIITKTVNSENKKEDETTEEVVVSLNPGVKNYIINVLGMDAQNGDYSLFVEDMFDMAHINACNSGIYTTIAISDKIETIKNYKEQFRSAITPWFVSELKGEGVTLDVKKLFRFWTISDGNAANAQIKVSIMNILPDEGLFDVVIRDYNDTDNSPIILERYTRCNMVPGSANYVGLKIGTYNGDYANKSKYVTIEVIENDVTETCVPCGFLGYPMRKNLVEEDYTILDMAYNTTMVEYIKPNRQYFGMSDISGVDLDVLNYKGKDAYFDEHTTANGYTKGFHLDSYINAKNLKKDNGEPLEIKVTVDGKTGFEFITPAETTGNDMGATKMPHITVESSTEGTIYEDKRFRKFTCYPYGGFDGWDIYREQRTNTKEYKANKYKGVVNAMIDDPAVINEFLTGKGVTSRVDLTSEQEKELKEILAKTEQVLNDEYTFSSVFNSGAFGLTGRVINSDYYAYLAGYKQFENPQKISINILATPGIDYINNEDLFNDVLEIVEESRQGDCIYIVTTPNKINRYNLEIDEVVANLDGTDINTSYAATYYPWVKYYDSANKKYIDLPATKDVVRNFAYTDNVAQPWFASAGMSRGDVDCVKACTFTKLEDEDALYEAMINPVKTFSSDGVKIWGNKTLYREDTPLNRINVRRLMIKIKDLVIRASRQLTFEQNDNTVEAQFRSLIDPILSNAKQNRGISDYKIQTDTSAEARDRKELPAKIWVKPINCLEYIPISFVVTPEGSNFED